MTELELDDKQRYAFTRFSSWLESRDENKSQVFRLFGCAGVGKTTLATYLGDKVDGTVLFAAFTGKASLVLSDKLRAAGLPHRASTIHRLIYIPVIGKDGKLCGFRLDPNSPLTEADLLIVDEVSMVSRKIAKDLESFGVPILVTGDPEQLQPVMGMECAYLSKKPDVMLTQMHRQAEGNPILNIADRVRRGLPLPARGDYVSDYGLVKVMKPQDVTPEILLCANIRLVGKNSTRHLYNERVRSLLGFSGDIPEPGETVICLRNCYDFQVDLYNGSLFVVENAEAVEQRYKGHTVSLVEMEIRNEFGDVVTVQVPIEFFAGLEEEVPDIVREHFHQFAFGYTVTVHKSQGSEYDKVLLLDQPIGSKSRWRYTGITRAARELVIVR